MLLIEHKWNIVPYTRKSALCPESTIHPTRYIEDIDVEESESYNEEAKHAVKRVTELTEFHMLRNGKLDGGQNDENMVEAGDVVAYNRSEDDKRKGIIFTKVKGKEGAII